MEPMEKHQSNRQCWLVVWNRKKLRVKDFFDAVKDKGEDISIALKDKEDEPLDEGDNGVIVIMEGDDEPRAVYATFVVTGAPGPREDTHPQFWKVKSKGKVDRALVRFERSFDPITDDDIVSNRELWMEKQNQNDIRWVRRISQTTYDMVRERAGNI